MAKRGLVYLSRLFSGRVLLFYLAWSIVVAVGCVALSPNSLRGEFPRDGSLSVCFLVWLNGLLVLALAVLLIARTEENASSCDNQPALCDLQKRFGIGYFFVDRQGVIQDSNDEFALMRGYKSRSELIGMSILKLLAFEDVAKTKQHVRQLVAGEMVSDVFIRRCRDGTVKYHMLIGRPAWSQEKIIGIEGLGIDVTAQKEIDDRMHRHLEELAQVQRVNSMGKIVSELAHEIAQPLYAITNYASACSDVVCTGSELQREMLIDWMERVTEQADRAASVVRRLRSYIHKSKSERVEVDLNRRIRNVLHLLAPGAREHSVEIEFHASESLPSVFADPIQIDQVTTNLIQNAIEAMADIPPRERRIMIETVYDQAGMVRVAVRDMGPGINKENMDRIFEAFFSTKNEGMGMGLAICRSIMHEHGGRLWPTHNLHRGTTFHFSLPINPGV